MGDRRLRGDRRWRADRPWRGGGRRRGRGVPAGGPVRGGTATGCGVNALDSGAAAGFGSGGEAAPCVGDAAGCGFGSGAAAPLGSDRIALGDLCAEPLSLSSGNLSDASSASENSESRRSDVLDQPHPLGPHRVGLGVELTELSLRVLGHRYRVRRCVLHAPVGLGARAPGDLGGLLVGDPRIAVVSSPTRESSASIAEVGDRWADSFAAIWPISCSSPSM